MKDKEEEVIEEEIEVEKPKELPSKAKYYEDLFGRNK